MDKIIPLNKGIHRQPSVGADGELSELVNLIPQNGELVNVRGLKEGDTPTLSDGERLLAIHKTQDGDKYIVYANGRFKYYTKGNEGWSGTIGDNFSISTGSKVDTIGNTLLILSSSGMRYLLWKDGGYTDLGTHIPELPITFGLQGKMGWNNAFDVPLPSYISSLGGQTFNEANRNALTGAIIPRVNEFIRERTVGNGRFMNPFFVRYAYRLYDGSLAMHSAPILMVCTSDPTPQCLVLEGEKDDNGINNLRLSIVAMLHSLDYAVADENGLRKLSNWKDIVKSVDVFISSPISAYDPAGKCEKMIGGTDVAYSICKNIGQAVSEDVLPLRYQRSDFYYLYATSTSSEIDKLTYPSFRISLPKRSDDEFRREIAESSLFYLLKSINVDDLKTERTQIDVAENILDTLTTREVMTDDYISHDTLTPSGTFVYNSRLNIYDVKRTLFDGFRHNTMQCYTSGFINNYKDKDYDKNDAMRIVDVYYYIRQGGKEIVVKSQSEIAYNTPIVWIYYPNPNAYKAVVHVYSYTPSDGECYEVRMEAHPLLYGAFFFSGWEELKKGNLIEPIVTLDKSVILEDAMFTSEVNNPFIFQPSGEKHIGTGKILSLSTAAKALSPSQFGMFPLYAFCTEGIWALEVEKDGTFRPAQPITRDVCNNPESITQIDDSVVFSTDQGLKIIQGSTTALLSAGMDGYNVSEGDFFPQDFFGGHGKPEYDMLVRQETRDFREILKTCRIAYDYANQLLRIFPDAESGSLSPYKYYVYSLTTHEFSTVIDDTFARKEGYDNVSAVITDYPSSLVQVGVKIYQPMTGDRAEKQKGILLTRPIALDEPFALKKLQDMRLHYSKFDGTSKCHVVVYISNDGTRWSVLNSLRKRAFKYYRFAIITDMKDMDALSGMVLRYEIERNNKLR